MRTPVKKKANVEDKGGIDGTDRAVININGKEADDEERAEQEENEKEEEAKDGEGKASKAMSKDKEQEAEEVRVSEWIEKNGRENEKSRLFTA